MTKMSFSICIDYDKNKQEKPCEKLQLITQQSLIHRITS